MDWQTQEVHMWAYDLCVPHPLAYHRCEVVRGGGSKDVCVAYVAQSMACILNINNMQ